MSPKPHTGTASQELVLSAVEAGKERSMVSPVTLRPQRPHTSPQAWTHPALPATLSLWRGSPSPTLGLAPRLPTPGFSPTQYARQPLVSGILVETVFPAAEGRHEWGRGTAGNGDRGSVVPLGAGTLLVASVGANVSDGASCSALFPSPAGPGCYENTGRGSFLQCVYIGKAGSYRLLSLHTPTLPSAHHSAPSLLNAQVFKTQAPLFIHFFHATC